MTGSLRVDKARYEDLLLGVLLTDINVRLDLGERGKTPGQGDRGRGVAGRERFAPGAHGR